MRGDLHIWRMRAFLPSQHPPAAVKRPEAEEHVHGLQRRLRLC